MERTNVFMECGSCGAYHRADYWGDCRNDEERFLNPPADSVCFTLEEQDFFTQE